MPSPRSWSASAPCRSRSCKPTGTASMNPMIQWQLRCTPRLRQNAMADRAAARAVNGALHAAAWACTACARCLPACSCMPSLSFTWLNYAQLASPAMSTCLACRILLGLPLTCYGVARGSAKLGTTMILAWNGLAKPDYARLGALSLLFLWF